MNIRKLVLALLLLFVSTFLFASYTHITFSISSEVGVKESARYRILGSTDWVEVKDKNKVGLCIDPSVDNRIVVETSEEGEDWNTLCTVSILSLPSSSSGASAKWMWKELPQSTTGARWKITGGKWNYIPVSEKSVSVDNLKMNKLTIFTIQSTEDGEVWETVSVHGVVPVLYNEKKLAETECDLCRKEENVIEIEVETKEKKETKEENKEEKTEEKAVEAPKKVSSEPKKSSASFLVYGGFTNSERTLFYTDNSQSYSTQRENGGEGGIAIMFNDKVGLDISFSMESHKYGERLFSESAFGMGFVFVENNNSFFSPYVKWLYQESFFSLGINEGRYAAVKSELGANFWFTSWFGIYAGANCSFSFISEKELRPEVAVDAINTRYGLSIGGLIRFGKGGTK